MDYIYGTLILIIYIYISLTITGSGKLPEDGPQPLPTQARAKPGTEARGVEADDAEEEAEGSGPNDLLLDLWPHIPNIAVRLLVFWARMPKAAVDFP